MSLEEWEDGAAGAALAAAAACPYCAQAGEGAGGAGGEPLDVAELCEHLEEAHPYEGPVECPFCHQEVAVDLVDHLIMDHGTGRRGSRGAGGWRQAAGEFGAAGEGSSSSAASAALRARKEAARQRFADDCMDTEDEEAEESFQKLLESLPSTSKVHLHRASAAHASSSKLKKRVDASPPRIRKAPRKEAFVEDTLTAEQKKRRQTRAHYVQSILLDTLGLD